MAMRRPHVHRGASACAQDERLPAAAALLCTPTTRCGMARAETTRPCGRGGGISRPGRKDPEQLLHASLEPRQKELLCTAHSIYLSPSQRLAACERQRQKQDRDARARSRRECPLSPVKSRPCSAVDCNCTLSHYTLSLNVPLDSPSQVYAVFLFRLYYGLPKSHNVLTTRSVRCRRSLASSSTSVARSAPHQS